jgi:hypothetical protein
MAGPISTRRATVDDVEAMLTIVAAGFGSYVKLAPPGWRPPPMHGDRELMATLLADPATWALLALDDGEVVGHFAFTPARERGAAEAPGIGATASRSRASPISGSCSCCRPGGAAAWRPCSTTRESRRCAAQGYERARLFTPSAQARARGFYERRG